MNIETLEQNLAWIAFWSGVALLFGITAFLIVRTYVRGRVWVATWEAAVWHGGLRPPRTLPDHRKILEETPSTTPMRTLLNDIIKAQQIYTRHYNKCVATWGLVWPKTLFGEPFFETVQHAMEMFDVCKPALDDLYQQYTDLRMQLHDVELRQRATPKDGTEESDPTAVTA